MLTSLYRYIVCFAIVLISAPATAQWVQTNGPSGGNVTCFLKMQSPDSSSARLFVGTNNGVFLSTNAGTTWTQPSDGLANISVSALAASRTNLFAATYSGAFLSTDYGSSWRSVSTGLPSLAIYALAQYQSASGDVSLFAGVGNAGVFVSTDDGTSWHAANNGLPTYCTVHAFGVSGTDLFIGTALGVYISTNEGRSWSAMTPSTGTFSTQCLAFGKDDAGKRLVYVGTAFSGVLSLNSGGGYFLSSGGFSDKNIRSLTFVGPYLYAATNSGGVYVLSDNVWRAINPGLASKHVNAIYYDSTGTYSTKLFAGTGGGVSVLNLSSGPWKSANSGLTCTQAWCFAATKAGNGRKNLFVGCLDAGLFVSSDDGSSWSAMNEGISNTYVCSLSPLAQDADSILFAGTSDGVFRSIDKGMSWTAVNEPTRGWYLYALAATAKNVFASRDLSLYRSSDGGTTWTELVTGWPRTRVIAFAVCVTEQGGTNIYAANSYQDSDNGIFCSIDEGASWTAVNSGLTNRLVSCFTTTPNDHGGTNLFAGTYGGVFASTNYGINWNPINSGLPDTAITSLASVVDNAGHACLFAGTRAGHVFLSTDSRASWRLMSTGLNGGAINSLEVQPDETGGGNLFAAVGTSGVWRRPLSEMIVTAINPGCAGIPNTYALNQNYPNPFNPSTSIQYDLPAASFTTLKIFNVLGQEVSVLVNEVKNAGTHTVTWNASAFSSGVYLCRLQAGVFIETKKLLLLK